MPAPIFPVVHQCAAPSGSPDPGGAANLRGCRHDQSPIVILLGLFLGVCALLLTAGFLHPVSAQADGGDSVRTGCAFATGGALSSSLCWLDFGGFSTINGEHTAAGQEQLEEFDGSLYGNVSNFPVTIDIPGTTLRLTAKLDVEGQGRGRVIRAMPFPTWESGNGSNGAFLGRHGLYLLDQQYRPALYMVKNSVQSATARVTLKEIRLTEGSTPVAHYSILVADAETTDRGEWISWTTDSEHGFKVLPNDPTKPQTPMGNACGGAVALEQDGFVARCDGPAEIHDKTGTAMLVADAPDQPGLGWSVTQEMSGNGQQGVAFAVQISGMEGTVEIPDRVVTEVGPDGPRFDDVDFKIQVQHNGDNPLTASTGTDGNQASTVPGSFVQSQSDDYVRWSVTASPEGALANYRQDWDCTLRNGMGEESTPSWAGASPEFVVGSGEFGLCTVTLTPARLTLQKALAGKPTAQLASPEAWDLSAGDLPYGPGSKAGVTYPVAAGNYRLSEVPNQANPNTASYRLADLSCVDDAGRPISSADDSVSLAAGDQVSCVFTNELAPARLTLIKEYTPEATVIMGSHAPDVEAWALSAMGMDRDSTVLLTGASGSPEVTDVEVTPGTYLLSERLPQWEGIVSLDRIACHDLKTDELVAMTNEEVVLEPGSEVACTFQNRAVDGTLTWKKVDEKSGVLLPDSAWTLTTDGHEPFEVQDCQQQGCVGQLDQDPTPGAFKVKGLPWGDYQLVESQAPAGYQRLTEARTANLQFGGILDLGPIGNSQIDGITLPLTGGIGRLGFLVPGLGIVIMAGALGAFHVRSRHRALAANHQ
ncbi:CshA/CshB family fibrillar adhesin-related protein [Actinomyces sp. F1_1611]